MKRELHPVVEDTQSSHLKSDVRNPFAVDAAAEQVLGSEHDSQLAASYGASGTGPRNMFNVGLDASQEGPLGMSGDCRRDLPDRPSAPLQDSQGYGQYPAPMAMADPYVATTEVQSQASPDKSAGRGILKDKSPVRYDG